MTGMLTGLYAGDDTIRVEPPRATLGQLQLTNRLEMIRIDDDVTGVAARLRSIDPGLVLMYDKGQKIWVLFWEGANEHGHRVEDFIGAYTELDARIVNLIERIDGQGRGKLDLARELDKLEARKDAEHERQRVETFGPLAEKLRWALRKDLGAEGSQSLPVTNGTYRNRAERRAADRRRRRSAAA